MVAVLFCLGEQSGEGDDVPSKPSFRLLLGPNAAVLLSSVGSVHAGSTFPAIQGASLTTLSSQPNSLVTGGFPAEDEQHSQPVSPQGLHYLHSAYRVGKDGQVGFSSPLERDSGQGCRLSLSICYCTRETWEKQDDDHMWSLKMKAKHCKIEQFSRTVRAEKKDK